MLEHVAIVVVNYGSSDLLAANLTRVSAHSPEARYYIVDNLTTARERGAVAALCESHGWEFAPQESNLGFGGGVNAGAALALAAGAQDLLLLNPDAFIDRPNLERIHAVAQDERMIVAAPEIHDVDGRSWFAGAVVQLTTGNMRRALDGPSAQEAAWITGACMWITRAVWDRVGPFHEDYFLYWEDVDYSIRAQRAGARVVVVREALAIHDEGGTQRESGNAGRPKSATYYYYNIRNRMLFATRNLDSEQIEAWRRSDLSAAKRILLRGGRRQFLQSLAPLRAGWQGVVAGRRLARQARLQASEAAR